jgi:hypothetical protein
MKKLLTIFLSIISLTLIAQVPQGVGYQGVATDANGIELVNQSISIRASVLSGSATGTIEWEETHSTSTDTFGLFTLTIGQGTNTTNGSQTSFADISWGTNTHFLKIEMDVTGGSNYSFMGTNQMMSVPYALYAENANINYDSISNLLSNDSTFITTVGGGIGGGSSNSSSSTQSIFTGISTPHGIIEINVDTTYNFIVPENIFLLHIEAAGGNGGGGGGWSYGTCSGSYPGGGGGGGHGASFKGLLTCSQGDTITFIVGSSGVSGNNATGWCSSGPTNGQSGSETKIMFGNEDIITLYEGSGGGAGNCYCAGYNGNVPTTGASGNNGSYSLGNLFNNSGLIIFETGTIGGGFIRIRY